MPRDNSSRTAVPILCSSGDVRLYHTLNLHLPHWLTLHPSLGFTAFLNVTRVEASELNRCGLTPPLHRFTSPLLKRRLHGRL
jgi:hypothetical protein